MALDTKGLMPHTPPTPPAQRLSPAMKHLEENEIPLMPAQVVKIHRYTPQPTSMLATENNLTPGITGNQEEYRLTTSNDKHISCPASDMEFAYPEPDLRLAIYKDYRTGQRIARQIHPNYVYSESRREL